jgi:hypothetical protein
VEHIGHLRHPTLFSTSSGAHASMANPDRSISNAKSPSVDQSSETDAGKSFVVFARLISAQGARGRRKALLRERGNTSSESGKPIGKR